MSPANRRITWLILAFVFLSLAGSVLPLLPGVETLLPLPLVGRDSALALHTLVLMAYMAFVFPLSLLAPEPGLDARDRRRWDLAWWWVGGFILAFSGVPLFVLAYIAGVHLKVVIAVLAWAGIFHGLAIVWTRLFGYRWRSVLVVLNFLLAVPVTALDHFSRLLDRPVSWWSPFAEVRGMTLDFQEPGLLLPLGLLGAISLLVWLPNRMPRIGPGALLLLLALVSLVGAGQGGGGAEVRLLGNAFFVPGRALPIELRAEPGQSISLDVAGRERLRWAPRPGEPTIRHYHASLLQSGERIVARDGRGRILIDQGVLALAADRRLVLVVGEIALDWPAEAELVRIEPEALDRSASGLGLYAALVLASGAEARLDRDQRAALVDALARGQVLIGPLAEGYTDEVLGRGRRLGHDGHRWPEGLTLEGREAPVAEANLYSSFALPDWGRVDLRGLMAFLGLYHLVFYLIFLLPLLIDARKGLGVYLVSVAFVLGLLIGGAYLVLKRVFLNENQILQQNVGVFVMTDMGGDQPLLLSQSTCFASFNGAVVGIELGLDEDPVLVYPPAARGPGRLELEGDHLTLAALRLDRRASKQMVRFEARADSPWRLEPGPEGYQIVTRPGVVDRFGLNSARIRAAFLRRGGHLHEVRVEGRLLRPAAEKAALRWHQVVPEDLRAEGIPFLTHALGRLGPEGDVMGVLLAGARLMHDEAGYLQRRDVLQLLLIPLAEN